jgi:hypothetical protein
MRSRLAVVVAVAALASCTTPTPTSTSSASAGATTQVPSAPAPSASRATPGSTLTPLLTTLVRPLAAGWRPAGPTAIVSVSTPSSRTVTLVAVPLAGGSALPLVEVQDLSGSVPASAFWDVRRDGSAIVFALATGPTGRRLALWELSSPRAEWLTPEPRTHTEEGSPLWSRDGRSVSFTRWGLSIGDYGVLSIRLDGTELPPLRGPSTVFGATSSISAITPDGVLVGADEFNGSTPWIRELATGRDRSLEIHDAQVLAWRASRPRGLVGVTTARLAPGGGYVALWDDIDGSLRRILERPAAGADFDSSGERVVIASDAFASDGRLRLAVTDATGAHARILTGTEDARAPRWLAQGILYLTFRDQPDHMELRLVAPSGGPPTVVYSVDGRLSGMRIVNGP